MSKIYLNADEIRKAISIIHPNNELFECRIIKGEKIRSAYFRNAGKLIEKLSDENLAGCNVYITMQKLHEGCAARVQYEHFLDARSKETPTTSDRDVLAYKYFIIDVDPDRPTGISSSQAELEAAETMTAEVKAVMEGSGYSKYIYALSGNGYHLLYPIDWKVSEKPKVEQALKNLKEMFKDRPCKIDSTVSNPARVLKLYGTLAQKGRDTEDRPHRMSKILGVEL